LICYRDESTLHELYAIQFPAICHSLHYTQSDMFWQNI
jgi:hypothetical protein